jgi:hypothetical protein
MMLINHDDLSQNISLPVALTPMLFYVLSYLSDYTADNQMILLCIFYSLARCVLARACVVCANADKFFLSMYTHFPPPPLREIKRRELREDYNNDEEILKLVNEGILGNLMLVLMLACKFFGRIISKF